MDGLLSLTRDQIVERIDCESKRRLGLPADELMRRYSKGLLDDPGEVADLIILAGLLAKDDRLFAAA